MACYHPLKARQVGINVETGKPRYALSKLMPGDDRSQYKIIPCGCCIGCRIDYSRQWADRCMLEAKDHDSNYFITLTYDNDHLDTVKSGFADRNTGEYKEILSLNKRDIQLWHKSLRKALDAENRPKIRFFACGEYGSPPTTENPNNTMRPHFHEIVFGLELDDLKFYKYNKIKQPLYTSEFLSKIWKKGYVIVGEVSWQSCAYVARYVTKKLKGADADLYKEKNLVPPFTLMSRKPGIGRKYYEEHPDMFDYKYINFSTPDGPIKIFPNRYFKSLLEVDDPVAYENLRNVNNMSAEFNSDFRDEVSDLDYVDQLKLEETLFNNRIRVLNRNEV